MSEEWGPWIEHEGKSKPANGIVFEGVWATGTRAIAVVGGPMVGRWKRSEIGYAGPAYASSWIWEGKGISVPIIRYRLRRPRALQQMIERAASLDATTPEREDA
jgi:hypothetical protein